MCDHIFRRPYEIDHVEGMIRLVYQNRVVFHDGSDEVAPGIEVHHIGGHTKGIQAVRVRTRRGWVVLASDAAHFYANWQQRRPFPILDSVPAYLDALLRVEKLASSPAHVIPGHDPLVLQRYPQAMPGVPDIVRVDLEPLA
jgi:glyoxylase-like metal-dependent hydrolase (beta-lactamase superfamily II)